MTIRSELLTQLYLNENPFKTVTYDTPDDGYPHTHLAEEIVQAILSFIRPIFWLEIGSMLGGSAIVTASMIKKQSLSCDVICFDPFCGDVNMWAWEKEKTEKNEWRFLALRDSVPTIRERFMSNIITAGHDDIVLPIPVTATIGMQLLKRLRTEGRISEMPAVIYLDSAHEEGETFMELRKAWSTLRPGGILFGDDWKWETVRNDVSKFAGTIEMKFRRVAGFMHSLNDFDNTNLINGVPVQKNHWFLLKS